MKNAPTSCRRWTSRCFCATGERMAEPLTTRFRQRFWLNLCSRTWMGKSPTTTNSMFSTAQATFIHVIVARFSGIKTHVLRREWQRLEIQLGVLVPRGRCSAAPATLDRNAGDSRGPGPPASPFSASTFTRSAARDHFGETDGLPGIRALGFPAAEGGTACSAISGVAGLQSCPCLAHAIWIDWGNQARGRGDFEASN